MNKQTDDSAPAFPVSIEAWDRGQGMGMTLRDYFAAHASDSDIEPVQLANLAIGTPITRSEARYKHADKMLEARAAK